MENGIAAIRHKLGIYTIVTRIGCGKVAESAILFVKRIGSFSFKKLSGFAPVLTGFWSGWETAPTGSGTKTGSKSGMCA